MNYRYKIIIEYLGTSFCGWQKQKNGISVQETIERAIYQFSGEMVMVYGSGRTDSGVHALGQVAHFDLSKQYIANKILSAINHFASPYPISILDCKEVPSDFHARFSAKKRHYYYRIINRSSKPIIELDRSLWVKQKLNIENMGKAAQVFIGTHDFSAFRASVCQAQSPIKTLEKITIEYDNNTEIKIFFSAISFLHHMVRNMVGALLKVGLDQWDENKILEVLNSKKRSLAATTAPASGLYLLKIEY